MTRVRFRSCVDDEDAGDDGEDCGSTDKTDKGLKKRSTAKAYDKHDQSPSKSTWHHDGAGLRRAGTGQADGTFRRTQASEARAGEGVREGESYSRQPTGTRLSVSKFRMQATTMELKVRLDPTLISFEEACGGVLRCAGHGGDRLCSPSGPQKGSGRGKVNTEVKGLFLRPDAEASEAHRPNV
ncbi:hypothetical protein CORC01_14366 [Colletotrichum orchidophilum]|uniref:Uncharacterized protein n=1 Tax=Colletotrichum orchidophilum TaxID=1209926 RepID=A0A1G4AMJ0_9PEZI|nr:uncharacterized protein CORC01_14366 [Colletotrichum orchidophilum]OHE90341.1 hypothetical protein CORC01_14366 [Colletotrichum orchidophilum]